ncbi:DUF4439 domain-containing protein [Arthrobacter deserti]|uniref:DUF4439 domain-containing protein n=1 Tax=Arthrobacter deserti TaxID=1742687 RepID=A0ABX1JPX3_9MICC|nr:DUF4439 domain-containing protein [Arthrobacter deserti]
MKSRAKPVPARPEAGPQVQRGGASRAARAAGRGLLLLLAGALVVGTGTVVTEPEGGAGRQDTTELARLQAAEQLQVLAADFEALAAARGGDVLADTAVLLSRQTQLLGPDTQLPAGTAASPGAAPATPDPDASAAAAGTVPGLGESTRRLAVVSRSLLSTAQDVEPGLARLLASIGAADYAQAALLQRETGTPEELPQPWQSPDTSWAGSCSEPGGAPTAADGTPAAGPSGRPTTADALGAVVVSERKLAYVYEAALPRLAGKARAAAQKRYLQHRALIGRWEGIARGLCMEVPPAEAAYELPAGLAAKPGPVLAEAEAAGAAAYADLVAFSSGNLRSRASGDLLGAVRRIADSSGSLSAAPGLGSLAGVSGGQAPTVRPPDAR